MKAICAFLLLISSSLSFAEHNATYCGDLLSGNRGRFEYGDTPEFIIKVDCKLNPSKTDCYPVEKSYGGLINVTGRKLATAQKLLKSGKPVCVEARWGGAPYSSWSIRRIDLTTDNITRIYSSPNFL